MLPLKAARFGKAVVLRAALPSALTACTRRPIPATKAGTSPNAPGVKCGDGSFLSSLDIGETSQRAVAHFLCQVTSEGIAEHSRRAPKALGECINNTPETFPRASRGRGIPILNGHTR